MSVTSMARLVRYRMAETGEKYTAGSPGRQGFRE